MFLNVFTGSKKMDITLFFDGLLEKILTIIKMDFIGPKITSSHMRFSSSNYFNALPPTLDVNI